MNATARTGGASAAIAAALVGGLLMAGPGRAQTPTRQGAPAAARPPPNAAPTLDRTARSAEMNMTTYEIMTPGRDMPVKYRKPRKPPR